MKIQVFGTGCPKCKKLYENANKAVADLKVEAEIEKIEDIKKIMAIGIMSTPALAIDGKIVSVGKILKPSDIKKLLR